MPGISRPTRMHNHTERTATKFTARPTLSALKRRLELHQPYGVYGLRCNTRLAHLLSSGRSSRISPICHVARPQQLSGMTMNEKSPNAHRNVKYPHCLVSVLQKSIRKPRTEQSQASMPLRPAISGTQARWTKSHHKQTIGKWVARGWRMDPLCLSSAGNTRLRAIHQEQAMRSCHQIRQSHQLHNEPMAMVMRRNSSNSYSDRWIHVQCLHLSPRRTDQEQAQQNMPVIVPHLSGCR
ncbi:uncharacterized protein BDZ83DRAFT_312947 [Colletotrichum acutatum]|uniref:Uncharacterized protein n=1 Tax=Glomerella acutata TaxID=27357 RepID=A0AAD8XF97_GLOAC|nr:uncharacterized protein BDZ83DRAFT_312947 [Colletotrichum acutatum]KAK1725127.1 hypothetical protein BDZ83DRAFT_312947 [Colletotrichum acutatum]